MNTEVREATKRQRYALWCITKDDYRTKDISFDEAARLIQTLGDPNYVKKSKKNNPKKEKEAIVKYLKDNHEELLEYFYEAVGHKSLLVDDIDPKNKPKYVFYGYGCGRAWVSGDKRNKNFKRLVEDEGIFYDAVNEFKTWLMRKIDPVVTNEMRSNGAPIGAFFSQDASFNAEILSVGMEYLRDNYGIKNFAIKTWIN